ncbi:hypothetical protein [Methylophaga sp.]|uniref:hypothetical protein n=1 Tax=Methylophaga sp. TaxID=2024840 RepID=UPI002721B494|nr:hypothetical protein [Methylophaga sp.]MDO8827861.1 hypothetical protein [Methylophaga sp.]
MAEKTEPTPRDSYIRRNFISECRDSRIVVEAHLSPNIRRIYRRHFDGLSRAVYLIRFYSRTSRINGVENSLTKDISDLMDEVNESLRKKITVAEHILANNNIKVTTPQFEKLNVTIIDPLANRFLQTIKMAQDLDEKLSSLWLACVLDDEQRIKAMVEIESELRSIQGKSRTISLGLRDRVRSQRSTNEEAEADNNLIAATSTDEGELDEETAETNKTIEEAAPARKPRKTSKDIKDQGEVEVEESSTSELKEKEDAAA